MLKKLVNFLSSPKPPKDSNPQRPITFKIESWGKYANNISKWQSENSRDQWIDANYSSKPLYQYSWITNTNGIKFISDPKNEFDKYAILIYLDQYKIGYVPRPLNGQYYYKILNSIKIKADIRGGNSKYIDEYGDLIVNKREPIIEITMMTYE